MKKNVLLISGIIVALILGFNSARKILTFKGTFEKVEESEQKLESLKLENEELKRELNYKKSDKFTEAEIRNKLGLAKEGEAIVLVPRENKQDEVENLKYIENWVKWRNLFFGEG